METAPLGQIKNELKILSHDRLQEICLRMAKFKKENKELLSYLLFDSINESGFVQNAKEDILFQFQNLNQGKYSSITNGLRKIQKSTDQYIRISGLKETELELLIYFCKTMRNKRLKFSSFPVVANIYNRMVAKAQKVYASLHPDLQTDFEEEINSI